VSLDWSELLDPATCRAARARGRALEDAPPLAGLFVVSLELELDGDELLGEWWTGRGRRPDGEVLGGGGRARGGRAAIARAVAARHHRRTERESDCKFFLPTLKVS